MDRVCGPVQPGTYRVAVGGGQPHDAKAGSESKTAEFMIKGTQVLPH